MAVTDYVEITATQNTQTKTVEVTIKTLSGFVSSIPRTYDDPQLGTGIFTGNVKFTVVVGSTNTVIGPVPANDNQTYLASLLPDQIYSSGKLIIQGEYSFTNPGPTPTSADSSANSTGSGETQTGSEETSSSSTTQ